MCVCLYICIYVCVGVCVSLYLCEFVCVCVQVFVCVQPLQGCKIIWPNLRINSKSTEMNGLIAFLDVSN